MRINIFTKTGLTEYYNVIKFIFGIRRRTQKGVLRPDRHVHIERVYCHHTRTGGEKAGIICEIICNYVDFLL